MAKHLKSKKRFLLSQKQKWKALTMVLSVCVAVGTTAALMLPAITMSDSSCELTEHTHSIAEGCYSITMEYTLTCDYETLGVHRHSPDCYNEDQNELCGYSDKLLHTHDSLCFDDTGVLVCSLPEIKEHRHRDECWVVPKTVLDKGHTHEDTCWEWFTSSEPNCGTEESAGHAHDETCMDADGGLICGKAETSGHQHDESCFKLIKGELICTEEEREPVIELGEPELICEREELIPHVHGEGCFLYDEERGEDVLICTETVVQTHQHSEACFAEVETPILICDIPEHTHGPECMPLEQDPNTADVLEFVSDAYVTTIIASEDARLPEDTVVTANPIYDSDEPSVAAFSLLEEESADNDNSAYVEEIINKIDWGEVVRIKLFDISLTANGEEVQPKQPVEVKTQFTEPLYISEDEMVYGVHFGANGVEILPASTERNENGEITAISHTQSSFSTTGYVLVHIPNEKDIGPDILPVHYCIWGNNQWVIVGSSRTGWYGDYHPRDEWPPRDDQRDYITVDQMYSVLDDYGLVLKEEPKGTLALSEKNIQELSETIWYQRAEDDPIKGTTVRHDTVAQQKDVDGDGTFEWILPLSGNYIKDDGYHIYFVPGGTISGCESDPSTTYDSNAELGEDLKPESKFYSLEVRDMNGIVYDGSTEEKMQDKIPGIQYVKCGSYGIVDVLANGEDGWQWVDDQGKATPATLFEPNSDGTETHIYYPMNCRMTLIPHSEAVKDATSDKTKMIDIVVHLDGEWQNVGHVSVQYRKDGVCNGEYFVTAGQLYTYLKNYGFDPTKYAPDDTMEQYRKFTYVEGRFDTLMEASDDPIMAICDNNVRIDNTTFAIGLGSETARDMTLFYLPGSDDERPTDVQVGFKEYANSDKIIGDRYFSITVSDNDQLVYYGHETSGFEVYVREGTVTEENAVSVEVQNAQSVLWSIVETWGKNEGYMAAAYTLTQGSNSDIYTFTSINGPIVIEASSLNPTFTVQYYANINRYQLLDSNTGSGTYFPLIDTANQTLPQNGETPALKYLAVVNASMGNTNQNAGDATPLLKVATYTDVAEIYDQKNFVYDKAHYWENIDKLYQNDGYTIESIWILKDGMDPFTEDEKSWWRYEVTDGGSNIEFTNLAHEENIPKDPDHEGVYKIEEGQKFKILITEGMIMRLFYSLNDEETFTDNNVSFYDYDVSSNGTSRVTEGINSVHNGHADQSNYAGYAFGNNNAETGTGSFRWNGNALNTYNNKAHGASLDSYSGCTFGLVTGVDASTGAVSWEEGITGPAIFGATATDGKANYTGSLNFYRSGDVYTLQSVSVGGHSRDQLQYFFNPDDTKHNVYTHIFTNNFWAMDGVTGKDKHGGGANPPTSWLPASDDGNNHNSYFGMSFAIDFHISDYIGPMEYIFFGDDDMWVFLDSDTDGDGTFEKSQLICDIGGVHSAVGEYVNLRDYLPVRDVNNGNALIDYRDDTYRLRFYYTERGASGSTCWMSFTLPSVTSAITENGTSTIEITKQLQDLDHNKIISSEDEDYEFQVNLYTDEDKQTAVTTPFSIKITRDYATENAKVEWYTTTSGKSFWMGSGDKAEIQGAPIGTWYEIKEVEDERFIVEVNGKEGWVLEGLTVAGVNTGSFTNIQKGAVLPNTGGPGKLPYIFGGWAMMVIASMLIYKTKRKNGRRQDM